MKKNLFALTMLTLVTLGAYAGNSDRYTYILDLSQVENDRTKVTLITPKIKTDEVLFSLPKTIPGTYSVLDYGRFVDTFKAFDKRGNELEVKKEGINGWKIFNAKKLSKISYWVADTFDYEFGEDIYIFEPAGTNIEEGLSFVINGGGFFGYFDGMTRNSFKFHIIRASSFYGATGLVATQTGKQVGEIKALKGWKGNPDQVLVDTYRTNTYDELIDSPLMYCEPDTSVFEVGGAEIIISSFSPEGKVKAADIKSNLITLLSAQKDYLGGELPVNKYAFIFYFTERKVRAIGALEHSYSSFYSLKNGSIEGMQRMMNRVTAHEFFHIVTPLNIHAEQIHQFNFDSPEMSEHLWLYEGITEFFAGNVQVKYGIMSPEAYLKNLQKKITRSKTAFNDSLAFTELSKYALTKHAKQYGNVYEKGALIGMGLDLKLRSLSNGTYGVQDLMADLSLKYGKDQAFKDEELFGVITSMTYPAIGEFLNTYVAGTSELPFEELFALAGVEYIEAFSKKEVSIGLTQKSVGYNPEAGKLFIANEKALDEIGKNIGLKQGDLLMKINGEEIPLAGMRDFFTKVKKEIKAGDLFTITVSRTNESGDSADQELSIEMKEIEVIEEHRLKLKEEITEAQQKVRQGWLSAEG